MTITKVERSGIARIRDVMERHLKAAADELGMTVSYGGGKFDSLSFTPKFKMAVKDPEGADAQAKKEFTIYAAHFGLSPDDFGRLFRCQGVTYKLVGIKPSRPKYAMEGECIRTGKRPLFTTSTVIRGWVVVAPAPAPLSPLPRPIPVTLAPTLAAALAAPKPAAPPPVPVAPPAPVAKPAAPKPPSSFATAGAGSW